MSISTNIIIYLFTKIKTVGEHSILKFFYEFFHNNSRFCIFVHILNSSFCQIFVTNTAFVTFPRLGIINNSSQNTCSLLSEITIFGKWSNKFFGMIFKIWMHEYIRNKFENIFIYSNFLKHLVYSRKKDKKSAKIFDSNLINVTKALHVRKHNMHSVCICF